MFGIISITIIQYITKIYLKRRKKMEKVKIGRINFIKIFK